MKSGLCGFVYKAEGRADAYINLHFSWRVIYGIKRFQNMNNW